MAWIRSNKKSSGGGDYTDTAWDGTLIANTYIDVNTGSQLSYNGWSSTDYIDINSAEKLYRCGSIVNVNYNAFYNSSKAYISGFGAGSITNAPANAKYVRLSGETNQMTGKIFTPA